jgi:hypothetical protein
MKNNKWKVRKRVICKLLPVSLLSLAVVVVAVIIGIGLLPALQRKVGASTGIQAWKLLEGLTGLVTVALIIGGGIFALVEYFKNEAEEERKEAESQFNLYQDIFNRLMHPDDIAARRWIINNLPVLKGDKEEWIKKVRSIIFEKPSGDSDTIALGHKHVKRVLNSFDNLGFVIQNYWDLEATLKDWLAPPIAKVWQRIGPYIEEEANRREEKDFYDSARKLGEECVEWRKEREFPEPKIVDNAL